MTAAGGVGFTPGPWTFVPAGGTREYGDDRTDMGRFTGADGTTVCEFGDETTYYPSNGFPPNEADARLIAAAPDLLDALSPLAAMYQPDAVGYMGDEHPDHDFIFAVNGKGLRLGDLRRAVAAIAKATSQDAALSRARGG